MVRLTFLSKKNTHKKAHEAYVKKDTLTNSIVLKTKKNLLYVKKFAVKISWFSSA